VVLCNELLLRFISMNVKQRHQGRFRRGDKRNEAPLVIGFLSQAYHCKALTLSALAKSCLLQHAEKKGRRIVIERMQSRLTRKAETRVEELLLFCKDPQWRITKLSLRSILTVYNVETTWNGGGL
jgi:hypothetical protein